MESLLGKEVMDKAGENVPVSSLSGKGKYIGLYFSAHWCPPCRMFTPKLIAWYKSMKKKNVDIEIVFVSSDRDEESWREYYEEMPWLSLPFELRDLKAELCTKFDVNGIPTFVILNAEDGVVFARDGRGKVTSSEGLNFPNWST
ncbi:tryparedoxin-like isoform X2 [Tubulanus polymorphus]|uniref:tryparedoxin-like isoform X2 n=1 Tax=Tubulanus polymorphus TaxID=672921 RepID=UPI003DA47528